MDYRKIMLEKIRHLLEGFITVSQFQDEYYDYFLDRAKQHDLTNVELDFFGLIHERLD